MEDKTNGAGGSHNHSEYLRIICVQPDVILASHSSHTHVENICGRSWINLFSLDDHMETIRDILVVMEVQ